MHIICNIDGAIAINGASVPSPQLSVRDRPAGFARRGGAAGDTSFDLDPSLIDFLRARTAWPVALSLVSEEPEQIVYAMLERHRLGQLPVFARRRVGPVVENPFGRKGCPVGGGICKCAIAGVWSRPQWAMTVYVGHARSDACVARRADLLFATGDLAELAWANALPFVPYETFGDVRLGLERRMAPIARPRPGPTSR